MGWWSRLVSRSRPSAFEPDDLPMPGWSLVSRRPTSAVWRDSSGDVISLTLAPPGVVRASLDDEAALRRYCRAAAEAQRAGLVEVATPVGAEGKWLTYIYKRLDMPAFTFFGVAATPVAEGTRVWTIVACERGMTGVREAVVTTRLVTTGQLPLEEYESRWAQDPYDPAYAGVDRRTLRYLSDAADYDAEFPQHPLSKVRRELRRLIDIRISRPDA
jgi:hypothetical protein